MLQLKQSVSNVPGTAAEVRCVATCTSPGWALGGTGNHDKMAGWEEAHHYTGSSERERGRGGEGVALWEHTAEAHPPQFAGQKHHVSTSGRETNVENKAENDP